MLIQEIYIYSPGDPTVGLQGEECTITAKGGFIIDTGVIAEEDEGSYLEECRAALAEAFEKVWNEPAFVQFDFEAKAIECDNF